MCAQLCKVGECVSMSTVVPLGPYGYCSQFTYVIFHPSWPSVAFSNVIWHSIILKKELSPQAFDFVALFPSRDSICSSWLSSLSGNGLIPRANMEMIVNLFHLPGKLVAF